MAASKVNKKTALAAINLPECPVCMETMSAPIFQCQSGHSLCSNCSRNLNPNLCPICRQLMTQMRNWQLEEIISKAKVACPNKELGCTYTLNSMDVENHLKECIFRNMNCPLSVFGKCSWNGLLREMLDHFKERHSSLCNVNSEADVVLRNIKTTEDDRHVYLTAQGKMLFVITFKIDTLQKMAYWTIQHIGTKFAANQHIYEIHVTSLKDPRRKAIFMEHCFNDTIKADEVYRQGKCAVIPIDVLQHFINKNVLAFRFYIRRMPPAASKNNEGNTKENKAQHSKDKANHVPTYSGQNKNPKPKFYKQRANANEQNP